MAEIVAIKPTAVEGPVAATLDKGMLRLTLANPPANALSLAVMAALTAELDRAKADKSVRVIVLAAAGKVFCAGHDLKEMTAHRADADRGKAFFEKTFAACCGADAGDRAPSQAGDRRGRRPGHRRRVAAGRQLRSGDCLA